METKGFLIWNHQKMLFNSFRFIWIPDMFLLCPPPRKDEYCVFVCVVGRGSLMRQHQGNNAAGNLFLVDRLFFINVMYIILYIIMNNG